MLMCPGSFFVRAVATDLPGLENDCKNITNVLRNYFLHVLNCLTETVRMV